MVYTPLHGVLQLGQLLADLLCIGDALGVIRQVVLPGDLIQSELHAIFAAGQKPFEGRRPLKFDKIVGILLDVLPVHQPPWQL